MMDRPSGIDEALSFASRGAKVLYMCEHRSDVNGVLDSVSESPGIRALRRTNGIQEIVMDEGGKVIVRAPGADIRGYSFDAVFAPPTVWDVPDRKADLVASTVGSRFFRPGAPVLFSTLQRIAG